MKLYRICLLVNFVFLSWVSSALSGWIGPDQVISAIWGKDAGQVGIEYSDTNDRFPQSILFGSNGKILVSDIANVRVIIFNADGSLYNYFSPVGLPAGITGWPTQWSSLSGTKILIKGGDKYQIYDYDGNLVSQFSGVATYIQELITLSDGSIIVYKSDEKKYYLYSPTGQLLQTYTERPLELGKVSETKRRSGEYRVKVTYPDKEWRITGEACPGYSRDTKGNLYCVGDTGIVRYNDCGKEVASLFIPESNIEEIPRSSELGSAESIIKVNVEYGSPVLGPNGDVYAWKRTPDTYSILKWTWADDPNDPKGGPDAPTNLVVTPAANGLSLTWKISPQDPGCVEGYEVERSSTSGGIFSNLTTTAPGVVKYNDTGAFTGSTYYYRIRAKSSCGPSPYTAEISGKRL